MAECKNANLIIHKLSAERPDRRPVIPVKIRKCFLIF